MSMGLTFDPRHKLAQELYRRAIAELQTVDKNYLHVGNLIIGRDQTWLNVSKAFPPTRGLSLLLRAVWLVGEIENAGSVGDLEWAVGVLRKRQVLDDLAEA